MAGKATKNTGRCSDGVIVGKNNDAGAGQHVSADQAKVLRLSLAGHRQAGQIGNALGHRHVGRSRSGSRRSVHVCRTPGDVSQRLGHVRSVRPQRLAGRRGAGQSSRQAARLERAWKSWRKAIACAWSPTACRSSTGAIPSRIESRKGRSACNCTPTTSRRKCSSRSLVLTTFPEDKLTTLKK